MNDNPYATPSAELADACGSEVADAEQVRRGHLNSEINIRIVGTLLLIGGTLTLVGGIFFVYTELTIRDLEGRETKEDSLAFVVPLLVLGLGILQLWTGSALRALRPAGKAPAVVFCSLGLFGFPLGTLINGFFLYVLLNAKGRRVLSDDYARIRELTPHVRYRTPMLAWVLLGIFVLGVLAAFVAPMFA